MRVMTADNCHAVREVVLYRRREIRMSVASKHELVRDARFR
jgi:hypothetical protein